jgi:hypothetical protein
VPLAFPNDPVVSMLTPPNGMLVLPHAPASLIGAMLTVLPDCGLAL